MKLDSYKMAIGAIGLLLALVLAIDVRAATTSATKYAGAEGAIAYNNTSASGSAIEGTVSTSGNTTIKIPFGVLGEYEASTSTFGIGLVGVSTSGYGVAAEALGSSAAMLGLADGTGGAMQLTSSGLGMQIQTFNGAGAIVSAGGSAPAVTATSSTGITVLAQTDNGDAGSFQSYRNGGGTGGAATVALTDGIGVAAFGNAQNYGTNPALEATAENAGDVFDGVQDDGDTTFSIAGSTANKSGNAPAGGSDLSIAGDVFVHGAFIVCTSSGCKSILSSAAQASQIATRSGIVDTYTAAQSEPTIETSGESRLTAGTSFVPLDPAFANKISLATPYLVFITPEGDTRGLYVARRSQTGFSVREQDRGSSNIAFTYRIVARPSGPQVARFAPAQAIHSPLFGRAAFPRHHPTLVPPPARIATLELH